MLGAVKSLFKNSIIYGIANSVQKLIPVIILPIITNHLGKEALKLYDVAFIYTYLFCAIILLSLDTAASVFYFDKKKENFDKRQVLSYSFYIQVLSLVFNFALIFSLHRQIGSSLFASDPSIKSYWMVAMWYIPGYMFLNYGLNVLLWQGKRLTYLVLCLLNTVLAIAGSIIAVRYFNGTVLHLFYVQIGAISLCGVVVTFLIRKEVFVWPFPLNNALVQKLFWFGVPFALTSFFRQLIPSIDRYFLLHFNFHQQLPYYILAVKIASFFTVASNAFVLAFTPYSLNKLNQDDAEKEISDLFRLVSIITFASIPVLLLFKDGLVQLFSNETYAVAAQLLPFLFMGWVFDLFTYFSMLGIYKSQSSTVVLLLLVLGTIIISGFNYLLVPAFGIYGAAVSFLLTKFLMFFITLAFLRKDFKVRLHVTSFMAIFLLSGLYCYLIYKLPLSVYLLLLIPLMLVVFLQLKNTFSIQSYRQLLKLKKIKSGI